MSTMTIYRVTIITNNGTSTHDIDLIGVVDSLFQNAIRERGIQRAVVSVEVIGENE